MDKLRHISMAVPDVEAAAAFYEKTFGMERVKAGSKNICLSDGTINLTLTPPVDGKVGIDHLGFVVADKEKAAEAIRANGGRAEGTKCWDANGIMVNVADKYWVGSK